MKTAYGLLPVIFLFVFACGNPEKINTSLIRDSVNVLTARQQEALSQEIKELEDSVGSQIGVLIVNSLHGEKIEDYSLRTANAWGLGRKEFNDGILITVAIQDREMRIEVGTGLENIIKDEIAAQIIHEEMTPEFKDAKYYEGLSKAVEHIKTLIQTNRHQIGQLSTITHETPVIDDFLVERVADTSVQDVSGSLVLIVQPSKDQLDQLLKEYGEEDLSTILDDASFYQSSAADLIDSLGIKTITSEKRFIRYRGITREWNIDLYKTNSPWLVIFFEPEQRPEIVPSIEVTEEKVKAYFKVD